MTFDQARDQISLKVAAQKRQGELDRYLKKLRSQAIIEWKNDEIRQAYEKQLAAPPAPARAQAPPS